MKPHEVEWLSKHLGHTAITHGIHYKSMSGYIERVNLGKLMLIQDANCSAQFKGKDLADVDVKGEHIQMAQNKSRV